MTNKSVLALVISSPGTLQNGLLALLTTIPPISAVLVAEDTKSALRMVENHQPGLIILELYSCKVGDLVRDLIQKIKEQCPPIHLIILAEDTAQQKEIEAFGVDSVLIKGFPAQKLIAIIESLINQREDPPLPQTDTEGGANAN